MFGELPPRHFILFEAIRKGVASLISFSVHLSFVYRKAYCEGLYMLDPESGTVGRGGLVGLGVSLWVWALRPLS